MFISTKDIYDKLTLAIEELRRVSIQMELARTDAADKETRIRSLEKWKYGIPPTAVASAVALYMQFSRTTGK